LDLGRRVALTVVVVGFAVKANANAGADAAAATLALLGRGLRDRLDGQSLDSRTCRVTADSSGSRIDHRTDAGHGQRRLGDVRGDDDAAVRLRLENAVLFGGREATVERKDFGRAAGIVSR